MKARSRREFLADVGRGMLGERGALEEPRLALLHDAPVPLAAPRMLEIEADERAVQKRHLHGLVPRDPEGSEAGVARPVAEPLAARDEAVAVALDGLEDRVERPGGAGRDARKCNAAKLI